MGNWMARHDQTVDRAVKPQHKIVCSLHVSDFLCIGFNCTFSRLKEIQDVPESSQLQFKEVHAVRWLSLYNALEVIYRLLDPLLTCIAEAADS